MPYLDDNFQPIFVYRVADKSQGTQQSWGTIGKPVFFYS